MKTRVFALYLPQYHPISENSNWYGPGFTEWTNVGRAKRLFRGHYQPRVPADLGYYDLRVAETRQAQADIARKYGVEGFIYWHYWFGNGRRIMERPLNEVLASGQPDFPFALAWANESWRSITHGKSTRETIMEQTYPGVEDYTAHFYAVLPAFKDKRYITIDGKPFFMIYKPMVMPDIELFIQTWQKLAAENGLPPIHFVGHNNETSVSDDQILAIKGIDAVNPVRLDHYKENERTAVMRFYDRWRKKIVGGPYTVPYKVVSRYLLREQDARHNVYPSIMPDWDHTPRSGRSGFALVGGTPQLFEQQVSRAVRLVADKPDEHRIIVIKSWNEWAEGNYMEPDQRWGHQYLEALCRHL